LGIYERHSRLKRRVSEMRKRSFCSSMYKTYLSLHISLSVTRLPGYQVRSQSKAANMGRRSLVQPLDSRLRRLCWCRDRRTRRGRPQHRPSLNCGFPMVGSTLHAGVDLQAHLEISRVVRTKPELTALLFSAWYPHVCGNSVLEIGTCARTCARGSARSRRLKLGLK
jgi:hypothetical protein